MTTLDYIFILCLFCTGYSYFIYPLLLLPFQHTNKYNLNQASPESEPHFISFIITAYNEESNIEEKILNTLKATYQEDKLEILVASDGSTDQTNSIVTKYENQGVRLIEVDDRKGKENAQLQAIKQARGDILVFSDVATSIETGALLRISSLFFNENIGAISSEDRFITSEGHIAGEGAYVKYEMWLRNLESKANSLVGLSGSFFACRASICDQWSINTPSDFNTAISSIRHGFIAITDPELLGYYPNIKDETKEYARKVRTVLRGMAALSQNLPLLNFANYGFFSFQLISHKIMRWLIPWFMLLTLLTNILLINQHFIYQLIFIGQVMFYLLAISGFLSPTLRNRKAIKLIYFFVQVNLAIAQAMIMFLRGARITKWEPSER